MIPGHEKRDLVKDLVQKMEEEAKFCCNCGLKITVRGKEISIRPVIRLTQADGKVVKTVTGLGGAFCTMCNLNSEQAHDLKIIEKGFEIQRDMETLAETYNTLVDEGMLKFLFFNLLKICNREPQRHNLFKFTQQKVKQPMCSHFFHAFV